MANISGIAYLFTVIYIGWVEEVKHENTLSVIRIPLQVLYALPVFINWALWLRFVRV